MERKRHGFVLHYRGAPSVGVAIEQALRTLLDGVPGFALLAAKMAWEIRPAGVDKGFAVRAIMARAPFAGRLPVFVGDDVTDEDGIAASVSLGGVGFRVDEVFGDPAGVRSWIADLANR
jgi:trehalose 6-phosphate phosphatase